MILILSSCFILTAGNMDQIKKSDMTELKSLKNPPESVKEVLRATAFIMGYNEEQVKVGDAKIN